ncbi:fructose-bisphosphate aldolase [Candidatus Falkowbacteria bacterium RIFOXYB2_FULL_38_15]|uniref:Probable fructose-bisphosphate aldolase class 1 n=1 Tax=Candidatus Falkowbacteria bacterium RIFOXYA2_FULL_38_12 TaxID=1797993 RepID=A0A1F5S1E2_9BACT|nr:MAG: fructose-bisphosphate aldolase [Candidatus Falkowbacteria bacterium RIFOXYA2_FULL_38_12]OGF32895.1 MAG: fructose-bisphosphate aldolase [Candidatus Falkowbacteria bacterium RIFOXYB2_FULL_38_15]OGF44151.1 MAG: fructose-bisphosphate aldolase [Candidatus Falkowbacteria bacterium RIFOXYD2_FULL_39_16]
MNEETLQSIAKKIITDYKGILAADESMPTAKKRLESIGLESTEENRRQYRELFLTTEGIENYISGVILFDETVYQKDSTGKLFIELLKEKGIIPGIKVDKGTIDMPLHPEEKITEGLDGLLESLKKYYELGLRFSKWRAVIKIGKDLPTDDCILENARILAEYAYLSQKAGIVPIVEPEVLLDGDHDLEKSEEITTKVLKIVFEELREKKVQLDGLILKSSMVISGKDCQIQANPEEIAAATIRCFKNSVPAEVSGIVFLSGGQTAIQATTNLNAVNKLNPSPWKISFSFGRALQGPSLEIWVGKSENISKAQKEFTKRMEANRAANKGEYILEMEQ